MQSLYEKSDSPPVLGFFTYLARESRRRDKLVSLKYVSSKYHVDIDVHFYKIYTHYPLYGEYLMVSLLKL